MTRPSDVKVREGTTPGTAYAGFEVGRKMQPVRFTITPDIVAEYARAVEAEPDTYKVDGRSAAPPHVLYVYMTAVVYRTYPPIQGIVMAEADFRWHHPIFADEDTEVVASGEIAEKFEKRGRRYIRWRGEFHRADGTRLATLVNTFHVPE
jgi:acyl dehydratase